MKEEEGVYGGSHGGGTRLTAGWRGLKPAKTNHYLLLLPVTARGKGLGLLRPAHGGGKEKQVACRWLLVGGSCWFLVP